ncbi:uncharacterized protein LOC130139995 [Syzygium oleosum]|uniref:uncharacterized protein LOC130139995 n=1 Tax=Syzygium oleosum TaxID=219896 RepID=UPI0024BA8A45|nr:uncharacterized protein LOC130139995 [Syzygium oleosum]
MGNCSLKGDAGKSPPKKSGNFRVLTDAGVIVEFQGPKIVQDVLDHYPGYGLFRQGCASSRLPCDERLAGGKMYYLLPLRKEQGQERDMEVGRELEAKEDVSPAGLEGRSLGAGLDLVEKFAGGLGPAMEVLPRDGNGMWKVKLAMDTKQLEEILSQQVNVEALIEQMRMAASSASLPPKRAKGSWAVGWKPALSNVFKAGFDDGK